MHTSVPTFLLGVGYDMGICPILILVLSIYPKKNWMFGNEYWVDTQKMWVFWAWVLGRCLYHTQ